MKRRDFLSLTARTAAGFTAAPVFASPDVALARHGGLAPRRVTRADDFVVSAESFTEGHPDKLADLIADDIVDRMQSDVLGLSFQGGVEVFASRSVIVVEGVLVSGSGPRHEEYEQRIRQLLRETGHHGHELTADPDKIEIRLEFDTWCADIARGINGEPGPDEQALVYGYATDETTELMPLPTLLAHRLSMRAAAVRRSGILPWLLPHGQTKVSVRYAAGEPVAIDSVEVSVQHLPEVDYALQWEAVLEKILLPVLPEEIQSRETPFFINPTGSCVTEGIFTKCGVSGRTLASDTYGAHCPLPAGGLAGQGSGSIRRLGTLMVRHLAKQVVAARLARRCTVHLAYHAGVPEPAALLVDTHGTGVVPEERIEQGLRDLFPLTPIGIFDYLDLGRPIYRKAAAFGYFGREDPEFTWEREDRIDALRAAV
jgi:S-adenosylmethionine synthetase